MKLIQDSSNKYADLKTCPLKSKELHFAMPPEFKKILTNLKMQKMQRIRNDHTATPLVSFETNQDDAAINFETRKPSNRNIVS